MLPSLTELTAFLTRFLLSAGLEFPHLHQLPTVSGHVTQLSAGSYPEGTSAATIIILFEDNAIVLSIRLFDSRTTQKLMDGF